MRTSCFAMAVITALLAFSGPGHAAGSYQTKPMFPDRKPAIAAMVPLPSVSLEHPFEGCGRGRVRNPATNQCRGPGDIK